MNIVSINKRIRFASQIVLLLILGSCSQANEGTKVQDLSPPAFSTAEIDRRVDKIMASMTLEEKIAQITGIGPRELIVDGRFSIEKCRELIPNGIGHICQTSSRVTFKREELRDFIRDIQRYLITETKTKIPAIVHEEAITGLSAWGATTFPQQIGIGCSWNPEMVTRNTTSTRENMRSTGITFALSPMLDLSRTAHWERIEESYGEDAYLTSRMGVAFVKGLQGDDFETGVAATTKHFAGYGAENESDKELYEEYLMPHEAVIKKAGVKSVMPSYGKYKGTLMVANPEMLTQKLRNEIGFDGLVVSDYSSVLGAYKWHKQAASLEEAAANALKAGTDIELARPDAFPTLPNALEQGLITQEVIDAAVRRSLIMKAKLGLLDPDPQIGKDGVLDFDPPEYRKLAYEAATQSIVLLKNNGILPLKKEGIKKIALVGPNAGTYHGLLGDYTYQSMISFWWSTPFDPNDPKLVTLKQGLESRLGDSAEIVHERGCDWNAPLESVVNSDGFGDDRLGKVQMMAIDGLPQPDLENALKIATESDVIIAGVGENYYLCGEGRLREGIRLPGEQEAFVEKLIATGKPVILVIFGGRQQIVSKFENKCAAIIQAWFPGEEGGNAIADIIMGNVNPSAKLCVTYPRTEDKKEINYKNGYKLSDTPQYPFGYGLSYTTFDYSEFKVQKEAFITDHHFTVTCKVKNIGQMDGAEIVQLYVSPINNPSLPPIQLKGFKRLELKVGEEKQVTFRVNPQQLIYREGNKWKVDSGEYKFKIGASSTDIRWQGSINIKGEDLILDSRDVFFSKVDIN